jgi:hypothetical protein
LGLFFKESHKAASSPDFIVALTNKERHKGKAGGRKAKRSDVDANREKKFGEMNKMQSKALNFP